MFEKIGNVTLNYHFYNGIDSYSDGDEEEEELLEICQNDKMEQIIYESNKWPVLYHLSDIRGNIINWYPIDSNATVLEIGSGCGAISGFLCRKAKRVVAIDLSKRRSVINAYRNKVYDNLEIMVGNFKDIELNEKFDVVTLIGVLEYASLYIGGEEPYVEMLERIQKYLKPNGKIIIAIENKMGLKYFNGACEDHVGRPYVGLEGYNNIKNVRTFSKPELSIILKKSGIDSFQFYYPSPDYKLPDTIYSDEHLPKIGELRTWGTNYDKIRMGIFNEGIVSDQICEDIMFDYFSNSFMVVCNEVENKVKYAHYSKGRKKEYQTETTIEAIDNKYIVKKEYLAICEREYDIIKNMREKYGELQAQFPKIEYLAAQIVEQHLEYEYIPGKSVDQILAHSIHNIDYLIEQFQAVFNILMQCEESLLNDFVETPAYRNFFGDNVVKTKEKSFSITNIDMLLHNLFLYKNKVFCIDYEWILDFPVPFEYVKYRMATNFYSRYAMYLSKSINRRDFLEKVGIKTENINVYNKMENKFYEYVCGENGYYNYLNKYKKGTGMIEIKVR